MILINYIIIHSSKIEEDNIKVYLSDRKYKKNIIEKYSKYNFEILFQNNNLIYKLVKHIIKFIRSYGKKFYLLKNKKLNLNYNYNLPSNYIVIDNAIDFVNKSNFWADISNFIYVSFHSRKDTNEINIPNSNKYISLDFFYKNIKLNDNYNYKSSNLLVNKFYYESNKWYNFFKLNNSKIYISFNKFEPNSIAASNAINSLNGVSAMVQSSYYEFVNSTSSIFSDLYFCFSNELFSQEIKSKSIVKNFICVGYINDYKFKLYKEKSKILRQKLNKNGALKIISFFDQGYTLDGKWFYDQDYLIYQYKSLFDFIIKNENIGLIIKSKQPGKMDLIFSRIREQYLKLKDTGRCYIYSSHDNFGVKDTLNPVCEASMASDLSIHNMLLAGTAGIESSLSGTPTIFFDDLNLKKSIFYQNETSKIVFSDWVEMMDSVENSIFYDLKKIYNWDGIINKVDPYRDGNAKERINSYINNLYYEISKNNNIEKSIEKNNKLFKEKWGYDKILSTYNNNNEDYLT